MDKQRMEIILPVRTNLSRDYKKPEADLYLSDLLSVNPIERKQNLKSKKKSPIRRVTNNFTRPVTKFENRKQEQFYRLNRENKLKQNNEWTELLKKSNTGGSKATLASNSQNLTCFKKLQETNQQINEASLQLEQISSFIEAKKKQMTKYNNKGQVLNIDHPKTTKSPNTNSNIKHVCAKQIYSEKVSDIDSMMRYMDKQMKIDTKLEPKQRERNSIQKKKLNETLGLVNTKLNKVKEKYFTNDFETNHINSIINKRPKYKSVKDLMKMDQNRLAQMEASKLIQAELENDLHSLSESNELFTIPKNNQMEVLYENVDLIQKESFKDNFSDVLRVDHSNIDKSPVTPRQLMHEGPKKMFNATFRVKSPIRIKSPVRVKSPSRVKSPNRVKSPIREEKKNSTIKSVAVDTQTLAENNFENTIMKSDFLMREFGYKTNKTVGATSNSRTESAVNNVTKKWAKDLDYFMT